MTRSAGKSGRKKQRIANRAARDIETSAGYIEKRRDLLSAVVKDITRNTDGLISTADIESQEQIDEAKEFLRVLGGNRQAAKEAAEHTEGYAQSVRSLEKQNATRKQRIACRRLGESLESVVRTLRKVESGLRKPSESLARRITEAEKRGAQ